jgi:CHAT domain-containing protein
MRGPHPACEAFDAVRFGPLPASRAEADDVVAAFGAKSGDGARVLRGGEATEAAVRAGVADRRVVHFATHGFHLDVLCAQPAAARTRGAGELADWDATAGPPVAAGGAPANPLRLAGLALAGANHRAEATSASGDGILTAEEVASLDLAAAEWAVLSTCRSGVGEVVAREGVFGLRRAFRIAGARTVIGSLWPVEDDDARRFMTTLYAHRFGAGLTTAAAMRATTLDRLAAARSSGRVGPPSTWAPFVAAGDWR